MLSAEIKSVSDDSRWGRCERNPQNAIASVRVSLTLNAKDIPDDAQHVDVLLAAHLILSDDSVWQCREGLLPPLTLFASENGYIGDRSLSFSVESTGYCFSYGDRVDLQIQKTMKTDSRQGGWCISFEFGRNGWNQISSEEFSTASELNNFIEANNSTA